MKDKKQNKKIKLNILWVISLMGLIMGCIYLYNYNPKICAYRYIFAYNKKDFEKVFSFYNEEAMLSKFTKEEVINLLKEESRVDNEISPKDLTIIKDERTKKYFVKFPYSLKNIYVYGPTGSNVYINNKKVAEIIESNGAEIKDMLPGKYQVTVEYYDNIMPPLTREIDISKEIKVTSPYETLDISIAPPPETWVTIGGIAKKSVGEELIFNNMLPGQYDISIFMGDKDVEVFSVNTQIDKENKAVHIENIKGNENVKENLQQFFSKFNIEYRNAIMKKDSTFLYKYLPEKINEDIITDFKMWYIDKKDIKDAKSLMEVRDVYPISGSELKVSVLETVYLTNQEKDENGEDVEQQYRVIIEWNYNLLRNNSTWEIINREIMQSMVAYKDEDGKWIKY